MRWVALPEFPGSLLAMRCRVKKPQVMPTLTWGFLVILSGQINIRHEVGASAPQENHLYACMVVALPTGKLLLR